MEILEKAKKQNSEVSKRILINGEAEVSSEETKVFAVSNILLIDNESQTIDSENAPMEIHHTLLRAGVVLLEGIRLAEVSEGVYFLIVAPLNLSVRLAIFSLLKFITSTDTVLRLYRFFI